MFIKYIRNMKVVYRNARGRGVSHSQDASVGGTKLFLHILSDLEGFKNLQGLGIECSLNTLEI
jgi:hypothetical protein